MPRRTLPLLSLLPAALLVLPGCFWGDAEANLFFKVSGGNYEQYEEILYPEARAEAWAEIFDSRPSVCVGGDADEGCEGGVFERGDLLDLYLPYETSRVRGMLTQKGDLQITSHLNVGEAFSVLVDDGFDDLSYLDDEGQLYGRSGTSCISTPELDPDDRTGAGRCLRQELIDNGNSYKTLGEDLRLVLLINLPGADDIRSTDCQDVETDFESDDWTYPRTLRVNYSAAQPAEGSETYGDPEEEPPLAQCQIEVFARMEAGVQGFSADWYGQEDEGGSFTLDRTNVAGEDAILGTVELEELVLPGEDGDARAKGYYRIAFTSDRFSARDGKLEAIGEFDVEIRTDREELEEPDRQTDLESLEDGEAG